MGIGRYIAKLLNLEKSGIGYWDDIKLYRDDNVALGDVLVKEFDFHFQREGLGSIEEYTK